jgi:DNA polymerase V
MTITFLHPYLSFSPMPLFNARIQAGFPSPTDDWLEEALDLNEHLIEHPSATFFARVQGESMIDAGIHKNDLLVIDRALSAKSYDLVVCVLDGDFTLKRIVFEGGSVALVPANKDFPVMHVQPHQDFEVWGVVKHVIHSV